MKKGGKKPSGNDKYGRARIEQDRKSATKKAMGGKKG